MGYNFYVDMFTEQL